MYFSEGVLTFQSKYSFKKSYKQLHVSFLYLGVLDIIRLSESHELGMLAWNRTAQFLLVFLIQGSWWTQEWLNRPVGVWKPQPLFIAHIITECEGVCGWWIMLRVVHPNSRKSWDSLILQYCWLKSIQWTTEISYYTVVMLSHSIVFNSLQPHGLQPARLLCPWDFPSKNSGVGCDSLSV